MNSTLVEVEPKKNRKADPNDFENAVIGGRNWYTKALAGLKEVGFTPSNVRNFSIAAKADWQCLKANSATTAAASAASRITARDLKDVSVSDALTAIEDAGVKLHPEGRTWLSKKFQETRSCAKEPGCFINSEDLKAFLTIAIFHASQRS